MNFQEYSYPKQSSLSTLSTSESNSSGSKSELLNFQSHNQRNNKNNQHPEKAQNKVQPINQQTNFKGMNFDQLYKVKEQHSNRFNNRNEQHPGVKREPQIKNKKFPAHYVKKFKEDSSICNFKFYPECLLGLNVFEGDIHKDFNKEEDYESDKEGIIRGAKKCINDLEEAFQYIKDKRERAFVNYNIYMKDKMRKWIKLTNNLPDVSNKN